MHRDAQAVSSLGKIPCSYERAPRFVPLHLQDSLYSVLWFQFVFASKVHISSQLLQQPHAITAA